MSAAELELALWSVASNTLITSFYSVFGLLIIRATLLGSPEFKENGAFYLGIIYGGMFFWNLALWVAWFYVKHTIRRNAIATHREGASK